MRRQWESEIKLEAEEAFALIKEQFPELQPKKISLLGAGWDNTAYLIDDRIVFRFPRRKIAVSFLEHEACMLPKIALRLPLTIPVPKWIGKPSKQGYPWPFVGYELLKGITACKASLTEDQRSRCAEPLARFLKCLHSIPVAEATACHLPTDDLGRLTVSKVLPQITKNLDELSLLGLIESPKKFEPLLAQTQHLRDPHSTTIVHGDFYVRHLIVNEDQELTGVIDWGDMSIGDPAIDFAIAHSFLPDKAQDIFRKCYGQITDDTWSLARFRALHSSALLAVFGFHTNDQEIMREGLQSLALIEKNPKL